MKVFSAAQIREWDAYTIKYEPITSIHLMERAARSCAQWLLESYPVPEQSIHIFCGKGNNGGDGLALARLLQDAGKQITVSILEFGHKGTDDFQTNLHRLHQYPITINYIQSANFLPQLLPTHLIIDALFGSGLNRPAEGLSAALIEHINNSGAPIISIDVPSGLSIDQHSNTTNIIKATHTLTFQTWKLAFLLPENELYCGNIEILPIGLHSQYEKETTVSYTLLNDALIHTYYKPRSPYAHKGNFGHALLIAGSTGKTGACIMAARACLRSGTGLLTCLLSPDTAPIIQSTVPEAMVTTSTEEAATIQRSTIGIGPGIGTTPSAKNLLQWALQLSTKPMLLDADALNLLSAHPELWSNVPAGSILTPHPKEFERLFGKTNDDFDKIKLAISKAAEKKCYIVLKGHHTFIAGPENTGWFNNTGNAGMATGGSGDVLSGIITALLAQGYPSMEAALLGVYLHGRAGDLALQKQSQESLIATDLIEYLGAAFNSIAQ